MNQIQQSIYIIWGIAVINICISSFTLACIYTDVHSLTKAIVDQHICHVVGNPEEMIKLATKGRCK